MLDKYKRLVWPYASAANVFVVISAVFGFIFIMNIPPLWGADETSHIGRIYQLSKGHLTANFFGYTRQQMGYGGNIPSNLYKMIVTTNADLTDNATASSIYGTKNVDSPVPYQTVGRLPLQSGKYTQYPFPNTAAYSLVAYLPEVPGMLFARLVNLSVTHTIELIRLCDLVFYIAVVYLALRLLGALRIRWLFFTIALMPTAIFQASIITADAVTLCLVILLSASIIKAMLTRTKPFTKLELGLLIAATVLVPVTKPGYILFIPLLFLIPNSKFSSRQKALLYKGLLFAATAVLFLAWTKASSGTAKAEGLFRPGPGWDKIVPAAQTHFITHHPLTYAKVLVRSAVLFDNNYISEMIGAFGFNHVVVPGVVIVSSIVCLLLAMLLQDGIRLSWKYTTTFAVAALAGAVLIATALYVTFSDVGYTTVEGLQGRYFLPLLPFFLGAIALALPAHLSFDRKKSQPFIVGLICVLLVGGLILSVLKYCYVTWG